MQLKHFVFSALVLSFFTAISQESRENPFSFQWNNGFSLESQDKQFAFKFGGRLMIDHGYFFQNEALDRNFGPLKSKNGTEIRRARVFMSGTVYGNAEFKMQLDFAGGETAFKDVYIGLKDIPALGTLRVGHVKEPFRFDVLTSSKYNTFLEPAPVRDFSQSRNSGLLVLNDFLDDRLSAQAGVFRMANDFGDDVLADDGYVLTGRITGLPIVKEEKRQLLHVGLGLSFRKPEQKTYSIASRPEAHMAPKYIKTDTLNNINSIVLTNLEAVYVHGPISFQGEYLYATTQNATLATFDTYNFRSFYGQLGYFITGESKNYRGSYEGFGRTRPNSNFGGTDRGWGAWEVALRYSRSNLNSKDVMGGNLTDFTLGLNWHLNPAMRLMLNHVWSTIENQGNATILQGRLQIDF